MTARFIHDPQDPFGGLLGLGQGEFFSPIYQLQAASPGSAPVIAVPEIVPPEFSPITAPPPEAVESLLRRQRHRRRHRRRHQRRHDLRSHLRCRGARQLHGRHRAGRIDPVGDDFQQHHRQSGHSLHRHRRRRICRPPQRRIPQLYDGQVRPDQPRHAGRHHVQRAAERDNDPGANPGRRLERAVEAVGNPGRQRHHHPRRRRQLLDRYQSEPAGWRCAARTDPRARPRPLRAAGRSATRHFRPVPLHQPRNHPDRGRSPNGI